jgi:hypothetical protein
MPSRSISTMTMQTGGIRQSVDQRCDRSLGLFRDDQLLLQVAHDDAQSHGERPTLQAPAGSGPEAPAAHVNRR